MEQLHEIIINSQMNFNQKIERIIEDKTFDIDMYKRFLNMQYHLTKGVQKHFFLLASSEITFKHKKFRKWLINFALEEEPHYLIAQKDLKNLGDSIGKIPLDIELWWLYFDKKMEEEPLSRIGATAILENISAKANSLIEVMLNSGDFVSPENSVFLRIHQHGPNLDHGNQVLEAIRQCDFSEKEFLQILQGAQVASTIYGRAMDGIIFNHV